MKKFIKFIVVIVIAAIVTSGLGFVFLFDVPAALAQPDTVEEDTWATNGTVSEIKVSGNTVYLGGDFTQVGAVANRAALVDNTTGEVVIPKLPVVNGDILTVAPDGSGNWYIGGSFTSVGGSTRFRAAKINADGTLASWNPAPNGTVRAMVVSGSTVYMGGSFSTVLGGARLYIAALNTTTGSATSWQPHANNAVYDISISGSDVYIAGTFTTAGGQTRNRVAKLNTGSNNADATWDANVNGSAYTIRVSGSDVYAGGDFTTVNGGLTTRNYVAKFNNTDGTADASWDAGANARIRYVAVDGSTVYVGGQFTTFKTGTYTRNYIAALNNTDGTPTSWNPNADAQLYYVAVSGSSVYVGGAFTTIGGQTRQRVAAIDKTTGNPTSWDPSAESNVYTIGFGPSSIFIGGGFILMNAKNRNYIAALDKTTGHATSWNPNADGSVRSIAVNGSTVYAGGLFTNIGGAARNRIAALDATTGSATAWNPNANSDVYALELDGSVIYVGGLFTNIGGAGRNRIAAIDLGTGLATVWNPSANNQVYDISVSGSNVYVAGNFGSIGGQAYRYAAKLNNTTGAAIVGWAPMPNAVCNDILADGSVIYVGGSFTLLGGGSRNALAALDATTGNITAWDPQISGGTMNDFVLYGATLYVGGGFTSAGGQGRVRLAGIDTTTGLATSWNPTANGTVYVLSTGSPVIYVGGNFTSTGGSSRYYFAQFGTSLPPQMQDTLSRLKVSTPSDHTVEIRLSTFTDWDAGDTLTLTFQSDFNLGALASTDATDFDINTGVEETVIDSATACGASDAIQVTSIAAQVITFTACPSYTPPGTNATVTIEIGTHATTGGTGDSQITNPTVAGDYDVDLGGTINETNACAVAIVDDDQVNITATVDPVFTFTISSNSCGLGTLVANVVSTCNYDLGVSTNAVSGAVITIQDVDDGDGTTGLDMDADSSKFLAPVIENNVVGTPTTTEAYGVAITLQVGTAWTPQGDFTDNDTPIPTSLTILVNTGGPLSDNSTNKVNVEHRVNSINTSPAGTYAQAVEYIATGTF